MNCRWLMMMLGCLLVWSALCLHTERAQAQTQAPKLPFVTGEIIVGFKPDADVTKKMESLREAVGTTLPGGARLSSVEIKQLDQQTVRLSCQFTTPGHTWLYGSAALAVLKEYAEKLQQDPAVTYAHPNWIVKMRRPLIKTPIHLDDVKSKRRARTMTTPSFGPDDLAYREGLLWHYSQPVSGINAVAAWQAHATGSKSVVVAVLDTGIVSDHPDIKGSENLLPGYDFVSEAFYERDTPAGRDSDPTDTGDSCASTSEGSSWHGTHVAGTIGVGITGNDLGISGINWHISILPVRVLGRCGSGTIEDIAAAIRWSAGLPVDGIPVNVHKADIINLSLGINGPCVPSYFGRLISAIEAARASGSTVVVAAGNESIDVKETTPAGCENVISVSASDRRGHLTPYSNYGHVTIMAPGGDLKRDDDEDGIPDGVWSLVAPSPDRPSGVAAYEGTSMAAPHVSGALALAIAQNPSLKWKPDEMASLLLRSAAKLPIEACSKPCGPGLVDAQALVLSGPDCAKPQPTDSVSQDPPFWSKFFAPIAVLVNRMMRHLTKPTVKPERSVDCRPRI